MHQDRSSIFSVLDENEILRRYRRNYSLGDKIGMEHVRRHAELEGQLTDKLIDSSRDNRWDVFSACYTELYSSLPWLNETPSRPGRSVAEWSRLIGVGASLFEIGSGKAQLVTYLAGRGVRCFASEITKTRGTPFAKEIPNLTWRQTDGVNLAAFEQEESFDYVISDQVVEHLHPDDIDLHFANALKILKPGGQYILRTPHRSAGPSDLSRVFGLDNCVFMHLHEFRFEDIRDAMRRAGFGKLRAVFRVPYLSRFTGLYALSGTFLRYQLICDKVERIFVKGPAARAALRRYLRILMIENSIWISGKR